MQTLRRFVQFGLGVEALALTASFFAVLAAIVLLVLRANPETVQPAVGIMFATALIGPLLATFPAIAWWAMRRNKSWARRWTIAASVLNAFLFASGVKEWLHMGHLAILPLYLLAGGLSVLGLIASCGKQGRPATRRPIRIKGDGTSKLKDYAAQAVSAGIVWVSLGGWTRWANQHHLEYPALIPFLIQMELAMLLTTAGHELGHLVAGWLVGKTLRSFQAGPFVWRTRNGRWTFDFNPRRFHGGAVGMVSDDLTNFRSRKAFSLAGGPVASFTMGAIFIVATLITPGHSWDQYWMFFAMLATFSISGFIVNLIPLKPDSQYSDGAQLVQVMTNGPWARIHFAFAMVTASLVSPLRPRHWNAEVLEDAAAVLPHGERGLLLRLFTCLHFLDANRVSEALASLEQAEALYEGSKFEKPEDICAEFVFVNAFFKHDLAAADKWWQRMSAMRNIDKDADYWRAKSALSWLKGELDLARVAWERGNAMAERLPSAGSYDFTRTCFAWLGEALEAPTRTAPPPLEWQVGLIAVEA